jgi:tRNA A-37 threonylcarbamoyl transferase component Bud32
MDTLLPRNPFFNRKRITDPAYFAGRTHEIEQLYSAMVTHQCRALVGERKLGKSSLLTMLAHRETLRRYRLDPSRYLFVYLDLEGMASAERADLWLELLERLSTLLPSGSLLNHIERVCNTTRLRFTDVRRVLRRVRDAGLTLVVMLDEFEALASNEAFAPDFYGELRSLAGELGVVYVTASKQSLFDLTYRHESTLSSPFFNIFSELRLGLMPDHEARLLLDALSTLGDGQPFCQEETDLATELAGPHPFFLQIAGAHLYDLSDRAQPQAPEAYDQVARRFAAEAEDHYRYLWMRLNPAQQAALLRPAQASAPLLKTLAAKGLLRDQAGCLVPFGHTFAVFLDRKRHEAAGATAAEPPEEPAAAAMRMLQVTDLTGQQLGKYRVLEPLGQGGMAKVYKAYQPMLDRYVAIKVLSPHVATDEEFRIRFQREATSVAKLRHTNIVQVFDVGIEGDLYYMVMEYIAGGTLKARLRRARQHGVRLAAAEVLTIARGVAAALDHAHGRSLVHRDVKPSNILLRVEDDSLPSDSDRACITPVLADFGVARILEGVEFTASGMTIGTPDYMAPEQGCGREACPAADIYALGVILFELLTGELPFAADTPMGVLLKHISDEPPSVRVRAPDLPQDVDEVLARALAKEPDARFPTADALVGALEQAWSRSAWLASSGDSLAAGGWA